jgi:hypothetical protein
LRRTSAADSSTRRAMLAVILRVVTHLHFNAGISGCTRPSCTGASRDCRRLHSWFPRPFLSGGYATDLLAGPAVPAADDHDLVRLGSGSRSCARARVEVPWSVVG